eukprot:TRINITY_DN22193_c0_g1_i2.p1 TRINITY_DN22193_c0_g1~~TRINITY_DN22193_c0_g1_i2.p1  ORF type:complete len:116 (+),score=17.30 TRINITY_DN22193_c0_g1_i2:634-981(+)
MARRRSLATKGVCGAMCEIKEHDTLPVPTTKVTAKEIPFMDELANGFGESSITSEVEAYIRKFNMIRLLQHDGLNRSAGSVIYLLLSKQLGSADYIHYNLGDITHFFMSGISLRK